MSKALKERMIKEISRELEGVEDGLLVDFQGLSSDDLEKLRASLRSRQANMQVVRNRLFLRTQVPELAADLKPMMKGQTAVAYSPSDVVAVAKSLVEFARTHEACRIKGGFIGGKVLTPDEARALSTLPGRQELLSLILRLVLAPTTDVANLLHASLVQVASLVDNHIRAKEKNNTEGGQS